MPRPRLLENSQSIIQFVKNNPNCSTEESRVGLGLTRSVATLKRYLQTLQEIFQTRVTQLTQSEYHNEMKRLAVDLS